MRSERWRGLVASPQFASLAILLVVLAAFSIANPKFLSPLNISNMMAFLPELGIMALGMTLLLTASEFDLSVGAVFALGPIIVMLLAQTAGVDIGVPTAGPGVSSRSPVRGMVRAQRARRRNTMW